METFKWDPRAIYTHCMNIASMPISTKESLEDLIGETGDHVSRDAKKQSGGMPERSFFYNTLSARLKSVPYVLLDRGEFVSEEARRDSALRETVFGEKAKVQSEVAKKVKEACKAGRVSSIACVRFFFSTASCSLQVWTSSPT